MPFYLFSQLLPRKCKSVELVTCILHLTKAEVKGQLSDIWKIIKQLMRTYNYVFMHYQWWIVSYKQITEEFNWYYSTYNS